VHYRKRDTRKVSINVELQPDFRERMVFHEGGTKKCGSAKFRPFGFSVPRSF